MPRFFFSTHSLLCFILFCFILFSFTDFILFSYDDFISIFCDDFILLLVYLPLQSYQIIVRVFFTMITIIIIIMIIIITIVENRFFTPFFLVLYPRLFFISCIPHILCHNVAYDVTA